MKKESGFGGDDRTKHNINSSTGRSSDGTPSSQGFTINNASTPVCMDGPSLEIITSFACCDTNIGKMLISCFVFQQA